MHNSALRALAKSVGISDRMIMYYFNTKEELIAEALLQIADGLVTTLEGIIPGGAGFRTADYQGNERINRTR